MGIILGGWGWVGMSGGGWGCVGVGALFDNAQFFYRFSKNGSVSSKYKKDEIANIANIVKLQRSLL